MTSVSARSLATSLDKLTITPELQKIPKSQKKPELMDSWEDEDDGNEEATSTTSPPPPTPASPTIRTKATAFDSPYQTLPPYGMHGTAESNSNPRSPPPSRRGAPASESMDGDRRPEKTTSAAARMIAAGIGQKAPRRTEEERKYDQAMKVQEKKKRDAAKEEEERAKRELEKARKSVWED